MTLYDKALALATRAHAGQVRKAGGQAYISHPVAVAAILKEAGLSEEVVAAALVHDVLEDTTVGEEELRRELGDSVVSIVKEVSEDKSLPWEERKRRYIATVREGSKAAQLVSLADKIHNLEGIVREYEQQGEAVWGVFTRGKEESLWYYSEMLKVFEESLDTPLVARYRTLVEHLRALV